MFVAVRKGRHFTLDTRLPLFQCLDCVWQSSGSSKNIQNLNVFKAGLAQVLCQWQWWPRTFRLFDRCAINKLQPLRVGPLMYPAAAPGVLQGQVSCRGIKTGRQCFASSSPRLRRPSSFAERASVASAVRSAYMLLGLTKLMIRPSRSSDTVKREPMHCIPH